MWKPEHEHRMQLLALAAGAPALVAALALLWAGSYPARLQWTATVVIVVRECRLRS